MLCNLCQDGVKPLSVSLLLLMLCIPHPAPAMTADDVGKAHELIAQAIALKQDISQAKKPHAFMRVAIYTERTSSAADTSDDSFCGRNWFISYGKKYCYRYSGDFQPVTPSYIADLQHQLDDVDNQLKALGVTPPDGSPSTPPVVKTPTITFERTDE